MWEMISFKNGGNKCMKNTLMQFFIKEIVITEVPFCTSEIGKNYRKWIWIYVCRNEYFYTFAASLRRIDVK